MICNEFDFVKFIGGNFVQGKIKTLSTSGFPYFIGVDLSDTIFDLDSNIDLDDFLLFYYYRDSQHLSKMDASRKYESTRGVSIFVKSDKDWSEQPAKEWVAVEAIKWKLEQAKEDGEDTSELEKVLNKAANALKAAEAKLQRRRDKFNTP